MLLLALVLNLSTATVAPPPKPTALEARAAQIVVEEVEKRSRLRWTVGAAKEGVPSVEFRRGTTPEEGFSIRTSGTRVEITAANGRGMIFGAGRLLRELRMSRDRVELPGDFTLTSAPKVKLRGHQLGYRPKTNSYDGWTAAMWDEYMRDLVVFGTNAIELIPPRSDDAPDSPHFPLPQMPMMIEMSRSAASYGMAVWVWMPALEKDYTDAKAVERSLQEWGDVFRQLPRVDAVMVPGGDPGHTAPKPLMALLEKQTEVLHRFHPKAQMWVSPQGFSKEWAEEFFAILRAEPAWLTGVVHGPQVRESLPELRRLVPARYPIRNYPDITHSIFCQFAVPDWDLAHELTHARESINPRPRDMRAIVRSSLADTVGFITYSEGCNDDVNKFVWSALGWDPDADLTQMLREYARYFIGPQFETEVEQGIFGLEHNWIGALATNASIEPTYELFHRLEQAATPQQKLNWRFQQLLYRAYYDELNRRRLLAAREVESRATAALEAAPAIGALASIEQAERTLSTPETPSELRTRIFALAEALYQSIRMQLSVPLYAAIARDRGATLDNIDTPLNNRGWLEARFADIRKMTSEPERLHALHSITHWTDPGAGGFYDDLGNPAAQPHLVRPLSYEQDPSHRDSPRNGFAFHARTPGDWRLSWIDHAEVMYDGPLELHYQNLDPGARYRVRIIYGGEQNAARIQRLTANNRFEIHPFRKIEQRTEPQEFDIPREATASGDLQLKWERQPGLAGNGRGNQVAEVWLLKVPATAQ